MFFFNLIDSCYILLFFKIIFIKTEKINIYFSFWNNFFNYLSSQNMEIFKKFFYLFILSKNYSVRFFSWSWICKGVWLQIKWRDNLNNECSILKLQLNALSYWALVVKQLFRIQNLKNFINCCNDTRKTPNQGVDL